MGRPADHWPGINILISFLIILNHYVSLAQGNSTTTDDEEASNQRRTVFPEQLICIECWWGHAMAFFASWLHFLDDSYFFFTAREVARATLPVSRHEHAVRLGLPSKFHFKLWKFIYDDQFSIVIEN